VEEGIQKYRSSSVKETAEIITNVLGLGAKSMLKQTEDIIAPIFNIF